MNAFVPANTRGVPSGICRSRLSLLSPGGQPGHAAPAAAAAAAAPAPALAALRVPPGLWQVSRLTCKGGSSCSCSGFPEDTGWTAAGIRVYFHFAKSSFPLKRVSAWGMLRGDQCASSLLHCWEVQEGLQCQAFIWRALNILWTSNSEIKIPLQIRIILTGL